MTEKNFFLFEVVTQWTIFKRTSYVKVYSDNYCDAIKKVIDFWAPKDIEEIRRVGGEKRQIILEQKKHSEIL